MTTDPIFYWMFEKLPSIFFQLVGRDEADAERYKFAAIEYKKAAVRTDGVFVPEHPEIDPAYIVEVQFYPSDEVYANLWTKIGLFLEHGHVHQDWIAVVIYPTRKLEQKNLKPYRCLLESDQLIRIYLDELPPAQPDQFALGILELIAAEQAEAVAKAKAIIPRVRKAKLPKKFERNLLEFILTVMLYKLPKMSREEVEAMLEVTDIRQTRVFQEALEEGREEGLEKGREEGREEGRNALVCKLLKKDRSIAEVAEMTDLSPAEVRKISKKSPK